MMAGKVFKGLVRKAFSSEPTKQKACWLAQVWSGLAVHVYLKEKTVSQQYEEGKDTHLYFRLLLFFLFREQIPQFIASEAWLLFTTRLRKKGGQKLIYRSGDS